MSKVTYVLGGIIVVLSLAAVCYFVTVLDSDLERKLEKVALQAEQAGSEVVFKFNGTGAVLMGRFDMDCGQVDISIQDTDHFRRRP